MSRLECGFESEPYFILIPDSPFCIQWVVQCRGRKSRHGRHSVCFQNHHAVCKTFRTRGVSYSGKVNGVTNRHPSAKPTTGGVERRIRPSDLVRARIDRHESRLKPLYWALFTMNADGKAQTPGRQASGSAEDIATATQHGRWQPRTEDARGTDTRTGILQRYRTYRHQDDAIRTIPIIREGQPRLPLSHFCVHILIFQANSQLRDCFPRRCQNGRSAH